MITHENHIKVVDGIEYDTSHNSPFDRGSADSYYRRMFRPHYYIDGKQITKDQMTPHEIDAYRTGYKFNDAMGDFKEYSYNPPPCQEEC